MSYEIMITYKPPTPTPIPRTRLSRSGSVEKLKQTFENPSTPCAPLQHASRTASPYGNTLPRAMSPSAHRIPIECIYGNDPGLASMRRRIGDCDCNACVRLRENHQIEKEAMSRHTSTESICRRRSRSYDKVQARGGSYRRDKSQPSYMGRRSVSPAARKSPGAYKPISTAQSKAGNGNVLDTGPRRYRTGPTNLSGESMEDSGHYGSDEIDGHSSRSSSVSSIDRLKNRKHNKREDRDNIDRHFDAFVSGKSSGAAVSKSSGGPGELGMNKAATLPAAIQSSNRSKSVPACSPGLMRAHQPTKQVWKFKQKVQQKKYETVPVTLTQRPMSEKGFGFTIKSDSAEPGTEAEAHTERFVIASVIANSKADRAGLEVGDELESVNDIVVNGDNHIEMVRGLIHDGTHAGHLSMAIKRYRLVQPPAPSYMKQGNLSRRPPPSPVQNFPRRPSPSPSGLHSRSTSGQSSGLNVGRGTSPTPRSGGTHQLDPEDSLSVITSTKVYDPDRLTRRSNGTSGSGLVAIAGESSEGSNRTPGQVQNFVPDAERDSARLRERRSSGEDPYYDRQVPLTGKAGRIEDFVPEAERSCSAGQMGRQEYSRTVIDRSRSPNTINPYGASPRTDVGLSNSSVVSPTPIRNFTLAEQVSRPLSVKTIAASGQNNRPQPTNPVHNQHGVKDIPAQNTAHSPRKQPMIKPGIVNSITPSPQHSSPEQLTSDMSISSASPYQASKSGGNANTVPSRQFPTAKNYLTTEEDLQLKQQKLLIARDELLTATNRPAGTTQNGDENNNASFAETHTLDTSPTMMGQLLQGERERTASADDQSSLKGKHSREHSTTSGSGREEICFSRMPLPWKRDSSPKPREHRQQQGQSQQYPQQYEHNLQHRIQHQEEQQQLQQQQQRIPSRQSVSPASQASNATASPSRHKPALDPALSYLQFEQKHKTAPFGNGNSSPHRCPPPENQPLNETSPYGHRQSPNFHNHLQGSPKLHSQKGPHWLVQEASGYGHITAQLDQERGRSPVNPSVGAPLPPINAYGSFGGIVESSPPRSMPPGRADVDDGDDDDDAQGEAIAVSGRQQCSHCRSELGRGAAMIIESLSLFYHLDCFNCYVCGVRMGTGVQGTDVRVRGGHLHCQKCYSNDEAGLQFSEV